MNVVATDVGTLVEVQGTAEGATFSRSHPGRDDGLGARRDRDPDRAAARSAGRAAAGPPGIPAETASRRRRRSRVRPPSREPGAAGHPQRQEAGRTAADPRRPGAGARPGRRRRSSRRSRRPGATFEENAVAKAVQAARETGEISLADDSGLAVDALNGMPGVLSARWSGRHGDDPANTALLLAQLGDVPDERRGAAFVCALALVVPGGRGRWSSGPSGAAGSSENPSAATGSATTRCSCRRRATRPATAGPRRNWRRRRRTRCRTAAGRWPCCCRSSPRCSSERATKRVTVGPCRTDRHPSRWRSSESRGACGARRPWR